MVEAIRQEIVKYCHFMAAKGLVAGTEGNVSARADERSIWVTPSGVNKGEVTADSLLRLDMDGEILEGEDMPTSERFMHLEFYRQRPGVGGIAHGHPIFSTAFAAAGRRLPKDILPELIATIGDVALVPYGRPSSPKLAAAIAPFCKSHNAFLLQNHGAIAVGGDVREAYHRLEVVEAYAKTVWAAEALGGVHPLSPEDVADLPAPRFD
ncbi:MAG: class II aldolase/adducin family protein [Alphaproteobacteria bacterium]|nr:class II aldolase/adducin family protein [Alphaproteobacteria bacterium]